METRIIKVRRGDVAAAAAEASAALRAGRLVGFPTETVYGVAALATDAAAVERLRELKGRPRLPFSVHTGDPQDLGRYVRNVPAAAANLISKAWPGPVTILLKVGGALADESLRKGGLYDRLCRDDVIGLRCPDSPAAGLMLRLAAAPVVASSANRAGGPSPRSAEEVMKQLGGKIDLLIDEGPTRYGQDSTIVDFSTPPWKIVRKGVLDSRDVRRLMTRRLLFVCTGNTCRSPMAEGLARLMLAERLGCKPAELEDRGIEISSAGVLASDGGRASPDAASAVAALGADISKHKTRRLTKSMIEGADAVFCMTRQQVRDARDLAPSAAGRIRRLSDLRDIEDPVGMSDEEYLRTARQIMRALEEAMEDFAAPAPPAGGGRKT